MGAPSPNQASSGAESVSMLAGKDTVFEGSVLTHFQNELGLSGNSRPGPSAGGGVRAAACGAAVAGWLPRKVAIAMPGRLDPCGSD
jgi:hypothetical protein